MRIQVAEVSDTITESGKNNKQYKSCVVTYYAAGKKYEKKLTQYSDAFKLLSAALPDQLFSIDLEKNGQFTEWKNVKPAEDEVQTEVAEVKQESKVKATRNFQKATGVADPRETPEERQARQELIVRQSSLTNAIEYVKLNNASGVATFVPEAKILEIAMTFRNFVYQKQEETN